MINTKANLPNTKEIPTYGRIDHRNAPWRQLHIHGDNSVQVSNAVSVAYKQIWNDGEGSPFPGSKPHDESKYTEVSVGHFVMHTLQWSDASEAEPIPVGNAEKVRIIPWSGGWDSTSYLFWYLKNTSYTIHAHQEFASDSKAEAEKWAVKNMLPIAQGIRPLFFTESQRDMRQCGFSGYAVQNAAYAGYLIANGYYEKGVRDIEVALGIFHGEMPPTPERMSVSRQYRAWLLFDALCSNMDHQTRPFVSWKLCHMTKHLLASGITESARQYVWTCEYPTAIENGYSICGKCLKCKEETRLLSDLISRR
jgi:hypothetical protein